MNVDRNMRVGRFFSLGEFLVSSSFPNIAALIEPTYEQVGNLFRLCALIADPLREKVGPIAPTSGIRSPILNSALGRIGYPASDTSQHMYGEAFDFVPPMAFSGQRIWIIFDYLHADEDVKQVIMYFDDHGNPSYLHASTKPIDGRRVHNGAMIKKPGQRFKTYDPAVHRTQ